MRLINKDGVIAENTKKALIRHLQKHDLMRHEQIKDSDDAWFDLNIMNRMLTLVLACIKQIVLRDVVDEELAAMGNAPERMRELLMNDYEAKLDQCLCDRASCYEKINVTANSHKV